MNEQDTKLRLFPGLTDKPFDPNVMLELAKNGRLEKVVILGTNEDGQFFFSASHGASPDILWHLFKAQHELLRIEHELEKGD